MTYASLVVKSLGVAGLLLACDGSRDYHLHPGMAGQGNSGTGGVPSAGAATTAGRSSSAGIAESGAPRPGGHTATGGTTGRDGEEGGASGEDATQGARDSAGGTQDEPSGGAGEAGDRSGAGGQVAGEGGDEAGGATGSCDPECGGDTPVCLAGRCVACGPNPTPTACQDNTPQFCDNTGSYQASASGPCTGDRTCVAGNCTCTLTTCGSACIDISMDPNNCGSCSHSCQTGACVAGKCQPVTLASNQHPDGVAVAGGRLFWSGAPITALVLSNGTYGPLADSQGPCAGAEGPIAVDSSNVYWTASYVCEMSLAGGTATSITAMFSNDTFGELNELAANNRMLFMIDPFDEQLISSEPSTYQWPYDSLIYTVAADDNGVYWVEGSRSASSYQLEQHGTYTLSDGKKTELASGFTRSDGITVYAKYVYWTTADSVLRVSEAGGTTETVADAQSGPSGIAVDASGVYWTNRSSNGTIQHAALAGGPVETLATGQNDPHGIALDATTVYWTNTAAGEVMKLAK